MPGEVIRFSVGTSTRRWGLVSSNRYPFAALTASREALVFTAPLARRVVVLRREVTRVYAERGRWSILGAIESTGDLNPTFRFYAPRLTKVLSELERLGWPCSADRCSDQAP